MIIAILGALLGLPAGASQADDTAAQQVRAEAHFGLKLLLGSALDGRFPSMQATWLPQSDGRWRVVVELPVDAAEIPSRPRYTRIMRGEMFFDSRRHPRIRFTSDAFDTYFLSHGGTLSGALSMRGVSRREELTFSPSTCRLPALTHCVIEAKGSIHRSQYGMTALKGVVGDEVWFHLKAVHGGGP